VITDILKEHLNGLRAVSKCTTGKWLDTQEPEVIQMFDELAKRPTTNIAALFRDIEPLDLPFRLTTFKLHMKGNCQCPKAS